MASKFKPRGHTLGETRRPSVVCVRAGLAFDGDHVGEKASTLASVRGDNLESLPLEVRDAVPLVSF